MKERAAGDPGKGAEITSPQSPLSEVFIILLQPRKESQAALMPLGTE